MDKGISVAAWSIDFETRSEVPISLGVYRYVEGEYADILCVAWQPPGESVRLWTPYQQSDDVTELWDHVASDGLVQAFNAEFEYVVWNKLFGTWADHNYGYIPQLRIEQLRCTQARAAAMSIRRSLAAACEDLNVPHDKKKDVRGKALIKKLCVPQKITKKNPHRFLPYSENTDLYNELFEYCKQDVLAEAEVARRLPPLIKLEQRVWECTLRINERGVPVATDEAAVIAEAIDAEKEALNEEAAELTDNEVDTVTQRGKLLAWMRTRGVMAADSTAETVTGLLSDDSLPKDVRRVLEILQLVSQTSVAKYGKIGEIVCADGTMKGLLTYHGAGPGRFSSRGGLNIQNLKRPTVKQAEQYIPDLLEGGLSWFNALYGDLLDGYAPSMVRSMVRAPAGYKFVVVDYKAIENRSAPWLAKDEDKLELFRKGLDEYVWFSANYLHRVPVAEVTEERRRQAKSACLGCVYGQGDTGYIDYAAKQGITITPEESKYTVDSWRTANHAIVDYWYACDKAAKDAISYQGQVFTAGRLRFRADSTWLQIHLPSGRKISFFKPRIEDITPPWAKGSGETRKTITIMCLNTHSRQWGRWPIIGSSIFQSANQGNARDIMVYGMLNAEKARYPQIMTVHDELVAQVAEDYGDLQTYFDLAVAVPEIYEGLPLGVEGYEATRYRK